MGWELRMTSSFFPIVTRYSVIALAGCNQDWDLLCKHLYGQAHRHCCCPKSLGILEGRWFWLWGWYDRQRAAEQGIEMTYSMSGVVWKSSASCSGSLDTCGLCHRNTATEWNRSRMRSRSCCVPSQLIGLLEISHSSPLFEHLWLFRAEFYLPSPCFPPCHLWKNETFGKV